MLVLAEGSGVGGGLKGLEMDTMITKWVLGKFEMTHHPHRT